MVTTKKTRKGASAVIFRMEKGEPEFLILHRIKRWTGWELLKGGRIEREHPLETLTRELKEETNTNPDQIKSIVEMPFLLKFKTSPDYIKKYKYTRMEFKSYIVEHVGKVSIKHNDIREHDAYKWTDYKNALKLLTFETSRNQLKLAHYFIKKGKFKD